MGVKEERIMGTYIYKLKVLFVWGDGSVRRVLACLCNGEISVPISDIRVRARLGM